MKIVVIATSVPDNQLEEIFCKIIEKVGVKINDRDIEFYCPVGSQGRTIIKLLPTVNES